jgi:predicted transposase/invertase (TIGR01784 family)
MNAIAKDNPIYEKAVMKVIEMSQDEKERRYAEAEEEQRFRERSLYDTGHTEGKSETTLAFAMSLKADGMDITLIQKYTGLSIEEIEKL